MTTRRAYSDVVNVEMITAMEVPDIRAHIFSFLPLESIKTCRLVCQEWNATAESFLLKLSRICFFNDRSFPDVSRLPQRFVDDFQDNPLLDKINKFCFNSSVSSMDLQDVEDFIDRFGSDMKELTISSLKLRSVSHEISDERLINLIPKNLSKLDVVCDEASSNFIVSMDRLKFMKTLRLDETILKLVDGVNVAPVELQISNSFFQERSKDYRICVTINNIFDFRNLQVLTLDCSETRNVELDVGGVINLKSLTLKNVKIINWETSKWTVNSLTLGKKMRLVTSSSIQFDELNFSGRSIDMSVLPSTLKRLMISGYRTKVKNIKLIGSFRHLEYLSFLRQEFSFLIYLKGCTKLTHLQLIPMLSEIGDDDDTPVIDVSLVPKSVKMFRLSANGILLGSMDRELETLVIENVSFVQAHQIARNQLKAKKVIFRCSSFAFITKEDVAENWMTDVCQEYIVGPFFSDEKSGLIYYFDKNAKAENLIKRTGGDVEVQQIGRIEMNKIIETCGWPQLCNLEMRFQLNVL